MLQIFQTLLDPVQVTKNIQRYLLSEKTELSLCYKFPKYKRLLVLQFPVLHFEYQELSGLSFTFQEQLFRSQWWFCRKTQNRLELLNVFLYHQVRRHSASHLTSVRRLLLSYLFSCNITGRLIPCIYTCRNECLRCAQMIQIVFHFEQYSGICMKKEQDGKKNKTLENGAKIPFYFTGEDR